MYYVLFETGNEAFFSRIVDEFCSATVKSVIDHYEKAGSSHQDGILGPFSCVSFPNIHCENHACRAGNKAVLTSDQLNKFEASITWANIALLKARNYIEKPLDRIHIQNLLQSCETANIHTVGHIPLKMKRGQPREEYLRAYIKQTNKLKNKADGFVYVRADTGSDFDYFVSKTALPNVHACTWRG